MNIMLLKRQWIALAVLFSFLLLTMAPAFSMSTQQEVEVGREASLKMEKKYGIAKESRYAQRIRTVGGRLAAVSPRQSIKYNFKVLNTGKFNAMAFPGGFIYATRGLMDKLNDGELAFVLGHETGHVIHKHSISQAEKQLLTTLGVFALTAVFNRGRINQGSANTAVLISYVMSNQYSQADERTADKEGVTLMAKAGYDPKYAVSGMQKLKKMSGGGLGVLNTFLGSHPLPDERIAAVKREGEKIAFNSKQGVNPTLVGKDYNQAGKDEYIREDDRRENQGEKRAGGGSSKHSDKSGRSPEVSADEPDGGLVRVNYGKLEDLDLRGGTTLSDWEREIRESLHAVKPGLKNDPQLDSQALSMTMKKSQPVVSDSRIIWIALEKEGTSLDSFMDKFRQDDIPLILSRRSDFTKTGVAVKKNKAGYVHVVVVLK